MEDIQKSFFELKNEVESIRKIILESRKYNQKVKELYKGCFTLFSPLLCNPTIMFFGINPGAGYYKKTGILMRDTDLDPTETFEYLEAMDNYDYTLARQTRIVFENTSYYHLLKMSVKTNCFYFATQGTNELWPLLNTINRDIGINLYKLSEKWSKQMIEMVNPKIILCEGAYSYRFICKLYGLPLKWSNNISYQKSPQSKIIIGYKRRFSNIINKNGLSTLLENELKKINTTLSQ